MKPLAVASIMAITLAPVSLSAQPVGMSAEVVPETAINIGETQYRLRRSISDKGSVVIIANRTGQPLRVENSLGMAASLETDETTSWSCTPGNYYANFVLSTSQGYTIASPGLSCGEALQIIVEG